jgi:hypothetical protein
MKTEKECVDRLDAVVSAIEKLAADVGPDVKTEDVPQDVKDQMILQTGILVNLAWVLDQEEELKPLLRAMRVQALADKLGEK